VQTSDINSVIYGNQAPTGADLENLGTLSISHSVVASLGNQNPGATTSNVIATDTATLLAASAPTAGQINYKVWVLAAQAGGPTPTGTVTLYDGNNNVLGTATLNANGQASFTVPANPTIPPIVHAVYAGDGNYSGSTSPPPLGEDYHFSGFLPPLNSTLTIAANRTVAIKFQLTDYNGNLLTSLSAIVSLQVLNSQGTNVLSSGGNNALRYDPTSNQFVANWQTKNLAAGSYQVVLKLADGSTHSKTIQLTAGGSSAGLVTDGSAGTATAGALLGGEVDLYVDNSNGDLTSDELARIQDAVTSIDTTIAPYGVVINEVSDPTQANVTLNMDTTSSLGGVAQGVLGCTTNADQVTMIQGWSWYAGADPTQIGAGQYDFETAVVHELGHVLGLGHSSSSTSVMYATLATGTANRTLVSADLNVPDSDSGPCALHVAPTVTVSATSDGQGMTAPSTTSVPSSSGTSLSPTETVFADFARMLSAAWNAYQSELSSVSALWQTADALAMQRLDALLSLEAGAMGMSKETLMRDLLFAGNSASSRM
jgi:hypothetical protein